MTSLIQEPFIISEQVFSDYFIATLYVPHGTKAKYEATYYWKWFQTIVEIGGTEPVKGDANGDSAVNMADVTAVQGLIAAGRTDTAADLNGDGRVDIADVILLLKQVGGKE